MTTKKIWMWLWSSGAVMFVASLFGWLYACTRNDTKMALLMLSVVLCALFFCNVAVFILRDKNDE